MKKILFLLMAVFVFFVLLVCVTLPSQGKEALQIPMKSSLKKTICLNMIVKNESSVIKNCLMSVKGLIDYWVIVDTGSNDGTQDLIKECMQGIPGELHERPWVNFEHNRNEALDLARHKTDYTLLMDADEILVFSEDFKKPSLDKDLYSVQLKQKEASDSIKWFMINNKLDWKWEGVLHETIKSSQAKTQELVGGVCNYSDTSLGARSKDPKKYLNDALVLEKELEKDPTNSRYQFYVANSYLNANELHLAFEHYKKRISMGGEPGEVFVSLYLKAKLEEHFQMPSQTVVRSYEEAHAHTPSRAEPLFFLACYYLNNKEYERAYETLKRVPLYQDPKDIFFTDNEIGDWKLQHRIAIVCFHLEKFQEMRAALKKVIAGKNVPKDVLEESIRNISILDSKY